MITRPLASGADDHDGEKGEGDDEEEGEVDHGPLVPLPYLCSQQVPAVDRLASLQATNRPAFNVESTIADSNNSHLEVPHSGQVEVKVAGGKVQLVQAQPPHLAHCQEKIRAWVARGGHLQGEGGNLLNVDRYGQHQLAAEQEGEGEEGGEGDVVEGGEGLAQVELEVVGVVGAVGHLNIGERG